MKERKQIKIEKYELRNKKEFLLLLKFENVKFILISLHLRLLVKINLLNEKHQKKFDLLENYLFD